MTDDEVAERLIQIETRFEEFRRALESQLAAMQSYREDEAAALRADLSGFKLSMNNDMVDARQATSDLAKVVRGVNGDNGIASRVRGLEDWREHNKDIHARVQTLEIAAGSAKDARQSAANVREKWETRHWAILAAIILAGVAIARQMIVG